MEKITRLSQDQRTDLAAYLDGELDETAAQEIEQVLARSEVARHEVDALARTWDLLDALPRPKASEDFARKTLSRLQVVESTKPLLQDRPWYRTARRGTALAVWGAGVVCAASLGFVAVHRWVPNETDQLLEELPIVERLDEYTEVGNVDFLQELRKHHTVRPQDAAANL